MGLYDQVQQTNSPYMSQFVGSIVPELNAYSGTMQKRYDTAADSDDSLGEALGNLQHLGLDADTQYANELKSNYYQRLQDRASSGDFENMGRRTRQDAIRFSQAYQPLVQRQKDYAEVVKKIQSDQNISDPATKQALIRQFQYNNTLKRDPTTGDFQRDGSGRIQLGGIQDAVYAPDVDINKKLLDELSKKEADIKAGKYFSDGRGNLVKTIDKVRDPKYIAYLANQMQQNDPEIKAMIARDTDLQTYDLSPEAVKQHLVNAGLNKSEYQQLKDKGLNDHEIGKASKVVPLDAMKAQLMQRGRTEQAAEREILNDQISQGIRNSHSSLVGGILGFDQQSNDHMTDHMAVLRATTAANAIKDPNLMVVDGNTATTSQEDPLQTTRGFVDIKKDLQATAQNTQTAIQAAMAKTGMSTGNPKQDVSNAISLMHNPVKLNALKLELAKTDPQEAQILETVAQSYQNKAAIAGIQESHINDIERAGKVDIDGLYKQYLKDKQGRSIYNMIDSKPVSKEDFIDQVRSMNQDHGMLGLGRLSKDVKVAFKDPVLINAANKYYEGITNGQKAMVDGTTQAAGYHPIVPTGPGKASQITDAVNDLALSNGLTGIDLNDPNKGSVDIARAMGIDAANYTDKKTKALEKGLTIQLNTESIGDKPTATVRSADGTSKVFQIQNLPPNLQDELNDQVIKAGAAAPTTAYGKHLMAQGYAGLGSASTADLTPQYLKLVNPGPSGVVKKLNEEFSTKVTDAGGGLRKYTLLYNNPDGTTRPTGHKFDSVDDLYNSLGWSRHRSITSQSEQATMNTQR